MQENYKIPNKYLDDANPTLIVLWNHALISN